jgi:transcriptional regulator with XRE-family HTH domain
MDFSFVVRRRLEELGLDQRDLANKAEVTESYISQLLGRKKLPPLPNRTDLYDKMSRVLGLTREELARLAALEHHEALDQKWIDVPAARFGPMRELVLGKCRHARQRQMRDIFEKQPFGELEQLITRTLIDVVRGEARRHVDDEGWVRSIAKTGRNSYREMRVRMIDLLDSDPHASAGDFSSFLDPLITSWDYDLDDLTLTVEVPGGTIRKFSFREEIADSPDSEEPGLRKFLRDATMNSGATAEEIEFLRRLRFPAAGARPTALFYYRTLQNLRDPLHFRLAKS